MIVALVKHETCKSSKFCETNQDLDVRSRTSTIYARTAGLLSLSNWRGYRLINAKYKQKIRREVQVDMQDIRTKEHLEDIPSQSCAFWAKLIYG